MFKIQHRHLIAALGLVLSSSSLLAKTTGTSCEGALCAVSNEGGFYVGLSGYYMEPSESGLGLFTDSWQYAGSAGAITSLSKPVDVDYKWDWGAKIGYDFGCSANSVELSYFHLNNSYGAYNDQSDSPISFGSDFFPNAFFDLAIAPDFVSDAHLRFKLDQVTLIGKRAYIDNGGRFVLSPSLGVRWAELKHDLTFLVGHVSSDFDGVGPVLGLDGTWGFMQCLSLVGRFDYSPLIGKIKSDSSLRNPDVSNFVSPKTDRVVHNINAKIGLDYVYTFCNGQQAQFELGWQASQYIDGVDIIRGNYQGTDPTTGFQVQRIAGIESNTFSVQGPYLDLVWRF